jgi:putative tryptophan/tyrosine transport system substrate-binding protein
MRRRDFITRLGGAAVTWPVAVRAQQSARMPIVGVLLAEANEQGLQARLAGLRQGLERLGWSDGRNIRMVFRFGEGKPDRFQQLAKELVAMKSDLIIAQAPPVVAAVQRETGVIPIVFVDVSDPIGPGFVASLARPGGNITGLMTFEAGIVGKWLAMLKEIVPTLTRGALAQQTFRSSKFDHLGGARSLRSRVFSAQKPPGPNLKLRPAFTTLTLVVMPTLFVTNPHGAPVAQTNPAGLTEPKP